MTQAGFNGSPPPTGAGPKVYSVVGATRQEWLDITCLEERIWGVKCHWVHDKVTKKGRSRACLDFEGKCPWCGSAPDTWIGFIAVWHHVERQRMVFRMGPEGAKQMVRYGTRGAGLVGVRLNVRASTIGHLSSLEIKEAREEPPINLPAAPDIQATVCLVLGAQHLPEYRRSADELVGPVESDENGGVS